MGVIWGTFCFLFFLPEAFGEKQAAALGSPHHPLGADGQRYFSPLTPTRAATYPSSPSGMEPSLHHDSS